MYIGDPEAQSRGETGSTPTCCPAGAISQGRGSSVTPRLPIPGPFLAWRPAHSTYHGPLLSWAFSEMCLLYTYNRAAWWLVMSALTGPWAVTSFHYEYAMVFPELKMSFQECLLHMRLYE